MQKQSDKAIEEMTKTHQGFIEQLQREHQEAMAELQFNDQQSIEALKEEVQEYKVRLAELNVIVKNDASEIQRLQKEAEKSQEAYKRI